MNRKSINREILDEIIDTEVDLDMMKGIEKLRWIG